MTEYYVGQKVLIVGINDRGKPPFESEVLKVGRKLVTVKAPWYGDAQFRMESNQINDQYGHYWLMTPESYAETIRRDQLLAAIRRADIYGRPYTNDQLERVLAILEEETE